MAYFSPLLPRAEEVSEALKLPHPQRNILSYAPPLEIPWSDVAVHVLHEKVGTIWSVMIDWLYSSDDADVNHAHLRHLEI